MAELFKGRFRYGKDKEPEQTVVEKVEQTEEEQLRDAIKVGIDSWLKDEIPKKGIKGRGHAIPYHLIAEHWTDRPALRNDKEPDVRLEARSKADGSMQLVALRLQYGKQDCRVYELFMGSAEPHLSVWIGDNQPFPLVDKKASNTTLKAFHTFLNFAQEFHKKQT